MAETIKEMVRRLKTNEKALMFLLKDLLVKEFLEENWDGNMMVLRDVWWDTNSKKLSEALTDKCYRLREDFELKEEDEYTYLKITIEDGRYIINGINPDGEIDSNSWVDLYDTCTMVSFCGLKFEGQSLDEWSFEVRQFMSITGVLYSMHYNDCFSATPVLARFKAEIE